MKILIDGSAHAGTPGGIQLYLERLVRELSGMSRVTVVTSAPSQFEDSGCEVIRIPKWTRTPRGRTLWELTALQRYCAPEFDALICVTPIAPPLTRTPVVSVVHDATPLVMHYDYEAKTKALLWAGLQTLRWADAAVTDSQHTKRDLERMRLVDPRRVFVAYPGIQTEPDLTDTSLGEQYRPYLLYVGSHKPNKNLRRLVAAFAHLRGRSSLRLVVAGRDEARYAAATEDAARTHGVADRVIILRTGLSAADISGLYRSCEAFVHPSLYEGFGLPLAEALAHGAPSACSASSSLPEVGGDAALYFDPTSVPDMRGKIQVLLDNGDVRQRLRTAGPVRARMFSWHRTAQSVLAAVESAGNVYRSRNPPSDGQPRHGN